jgi:hypothetical protein
MRRDVLSLGSFPSGSCEEIAGNAPVKELLVKPLSG